MIDPASAIGLGSGVGSMIGMIMRIITGIADKKIKLAEMELEKERQKQKHYEKLQGNSHDYIKDMEQNQKVDKGEPFKFKLGKNLFTYEGTKPDRILPARNSRSLFMLTATYCFAIVICFLCGDIVIFERPTDTAPNVFELGFGIIRSESSGRTVYVQTLAGLGSALLTTTSIILTASFVGLDPRRR